MIGFIVIIINIALIYLTLTYYYRYHKLSSTLLLIVLLGLTFKNTALIFNNLLSTAILLKAGSAAMVLFSFSILIVIIQTGTISIKYTYLPIVRKTTWALSIFFMFLWFFVNQLEILTNSLVLNYVLNNIIEFTIVTLVLIVGIYTYLHKKQWYLLAGSISYFLGLFLLYSINLKSIESFALVQTIFILFIVLNEKKTFIKSVR